MPKQKSHVSARRSADRIWLNSAADTAASGPKYLTIANAIARAVEAGDLSPGDRLPPQRSVAETLGVDLTTVTRAYSHARTLGVLEGEIGRGTFVRGVASRTGPIIDLSMNLPPSPPDVSWRELMSRGVAAAFGDSDPALMMTYRAQMGSRRDRRAAAQWLHPLLSAIDPERIRLAQGAHGALAALLPMLMKAGDTALADPWTYPGFIALAQSLGIKVAAMACDDEGPLLAELETQCKRLRPKVLYLNSTLQNPTTRTISPQRRAGIAAIAKKHDIFILEDDPYALLLAPIAPLATHDSERVIYISTLSKCLTPGLRTAFVVAPPALAEKVEEALHTSSLMPAPLLSDIATRWLENGTAKRILTSVRSESAARMKLARSILPKRAAGGPNGFHLWMSLPKGWDPAAYAAAARALGVFLVSSQTFAVDAQSEAHVRISLGAPATRDDLARGLHALAALEA